MRKEYGSKGINLIERRDVTPRRYIVRWGIENLPEDSEVKGVSFYEDDIYGVITIETIRSVILSGMNEIIDKKILSGFVWRDMQVWLSSENQFNYKAAYDLAVMAEGKTLPVVFKFGTTDEPIYYEFTTLDELSDFYLRAMKYINDCLSEGWKMKDGIDWSEYEEALKKL